MYDYYLFPLPRASKWTRLIFDHSEVKIDQYLSKAFPGQLHEALCKCIGMIFAERVYAKVAQLVEYISYNDRLFNLWESGVRVPLCTYFFFLGLCSFLFNFISLLFYFHYFLLIIRHFINIISAI